LGGEDRGELQGGGEAREGERGTAGKTVGRGGAEGRWRGSEVENGRIRGNEYFPVNARFLREKIKKGESGMAPAQRSSRNQKVNEPT